MQKADAQGVFAMETEEEEVVKEEEMKLLHVSVVSVTALNGCEATQ